MTLRKRGRPSGSSRLNQADETAMARMADVMLSAPSMSPTAAMRRAGITDDSHQRRMRRKWKESGERHLDAARRRKDESQQRSVPADHQPIGISGNFRHYSSLSESVIRAHERMEREHRLHEKIRQQIKMMDQTAKIQRAFDQAAKVQKTIDQMGGYSKIKQMFDEHERQRRMLDNLGIGRFSY